MSSCSSRMPAFGSTTFSFGFCGAAVILVGALSSAAEGAFGLASGGSSSFDGSAGFGPFADSGGSACSGTSAGFGGSAGSGTSTGFGGSAGFGSSAAGLGVVAGFGAAAATFAAPRRPPHLLFFLSLGLAVSVINVGSAPSAML